MLFACKSNKFYAVFENREKRGFSNNFDDISTFNHFFNFQLIASFVTLIMFRKQTNVDIK